jgi:diguanylate cyclase (GGDEF)-like protein
VGRPTATQEAVAGERRPGAALVLVQLGLLALAASTAVATPAWNHWRVGMLLSLIAFAIVCNLTAVRTSSKKFQVDAGLAAVMLGVVFLGGAPAALISTLGVVAVSIRNRSRPHVVLNNVATFACFPLAAGLFFHGVTSLVGTGPTHAVYYLLVFPAFAVALAVNAVGVLGHNCYLERSPLLEKLRDVLLPLVSAELFSAVLTVAAVYFVFKTGIAGIAVLLLVFAIFQYLIGELVKSQERAQELHRKATTDDLTELANRHEFGSIVEREVDLSAPAGMPFAIMLLDLDHFKEINDTLGHHYGDVLLRDLGPRLAACVGPNGVVARLGGDEFAVLPGMRTDDPETLRQIADELIACVQEPLIVDQMTLEVGASVGVSRFPLDGEDASALLRRADIAMYAAKEDHSSVKLYEATMDRYSIRRLTVVSDFRRALKSEEFVVHYQPIIEVDGSDPCGAEALVRWEHPELGLIPPSDFIPIAEQSGLIGGLTRHVLDRAIAECTGWRNAGADLTVSVNLSVRDLLDRDLPREIDRMLANHGLSPEALKLEITESMIMSDPERALATVTRLREAGLRISVDDFGTGYSSLAYLKRLPINELKIDRSFVSPMLKDESDLIIVRSTINLGHDLGLRVVAEGVEDERTLKQLELLGCDLAQGYHMSRPLTADAFAEWIGVTETESAERAARA